MREPFPYQLEGIKYLAATPQAVLADEMGLGKTFQVIEVIRRNIRKLPDGVFLVICPKIAVSVWVRELNTMGFSCVTMLNKSDVTKHRSAKGWIIVTIDVFRMNHPLFEVPSILVLDEAHRIKDIKTKINQAFTPFATRAPRVWLLTGTPIKNHYGEYYALARVTIPYKRLREYGVTDQWRWEEAFCHVTNEVIYVKGGQMRQVRKIVGSRNGKVLKELIGPYMLRRKLKEVLKDIPALHWQPLPVTINGSFLSGLSPQEQEEAIMAAESGREPRNKHIMAARAEMALELAKPAVEVVEAYFETTGEPMVVFCYHLDALFYMKSELESKGLRVAMLYGDTPALERGRIEDAFQKGEYDALLGQTLSAGVAITLTRAKYGLFVDLCWSPADNAQARKRLHRIGQSEEVLFHYLVVPQDPLSMRVTGILADKTEALVEVGLEE